MDDTICRIVSIHSLRVPTKKTYGAERLRDTHCSVRLVILAVSIHQRFQVIARGCALFASNRFSQKTIVRIALSPVSNGDGWRVRRYTQDAG